MDCINNIITAQQLDLQDLDKKVIIRFKKLKGKNKTYIYGLDKIVEKTKLDEFLKKIKKKLGCGGFFANDEDGNNIIEFMGDHRLVMKELIQEEKFMPNIKIELRGA
jgi:translation initiation factor 1 (eIF-1/SUI1)